MPPLQYANVVLVSYLKGDSMVDFLKIPRLVVFFFLDWVTLLVSRELAVSFTPISWLL